MDVAATPLAVTLMVLEEETAFPIALPRGRVNTYLTGVRQHVNEREKRCCAHVSNFTSYRGTLCGAVHQTSRPFA